MAFDFEKLRFRIDTVPGTKLLIDQFPELAEYKEFNDPKNDKILRVAIFATDEGSPFIRLEREDYERRIIKIFEYLNFKDNKILSEICLGNHKDYELMINRYFMFCDNLAYIMWSTKLRMFHGINQALRKPIDMDNMPDLSKRAALDKQLKEIYVDLLDYESQIFTDIPTRKKLRKQVAKLIQPAEQYAVAKQVI